MLVESRSLLGAEIDNGEYAAPSYYGKWMKVNNHREEFEMELMRYLFSKSNACISEIIGLSKDEIDLTIPYYAAIIEIDLTNDKIDWYQLRTFSKNYILKMRFNIISIAGQNYLIVIVPARFITTTLKEDPYYLKLIKYKEAIEERFNIGVSQGIGQPYPILKLKKSFNQARIALSLSKIKGKKSFTQQFSDLGLFSWIFSQDIEILQSFCHKTLGKLIDNDYLMDTLRKLSNNGFALKITADSLFIHVNTLYYRVARIEELIGADLSNIATRMNIYTAIIIWDTLKEAEL
ncbi:PucR family transcriptional regulator [Desulfitobacterium sp. Sab5]|uniref:PucR family transcriptional regulator n=1 Tax=Desulfitobacterium nosdiversum TaxID=3375356 RepID=UPI003CF072FB